MAPSRGKGKTTGRATQNDARAPIRRSKRGGASTYTDDDVADVYKTMVAEAETEGSVETDRPLKRRRMNPASRSKERTTAENQCANLGTSSSPARQPAQGPTGTASGRLQTIENSSESEESDLEFEDVDIDHAHETVDEQADGIEDLSIDVQAESNTRRNLTARRKPATTIEKAHRLLVHKLHVLCLMGHCMYVNGRCNNATAQRHVRSILSSKSISYLNPKRDDTQFQRNRSFMDGLQQAVDAFVAEYRVKGSGLMKPQWSLDGDAPEVRETGLGPTDSSDFVSAAKDLEGSQDMGNQLYCTLLRSVGVDARIVCSLQPLPFSSVPKASTPKKAIDAAFVAIAPDVTPSKANTDGEDTAVSGSSTIGKVPSARRRLGQPNFAAESSKPPIPKKRPKPVPKLQYPVFWVEAFNEASQKWIAIDPVVTNTVNKPSKLEPPASYDLAQLTYVIALEDDGSARDVTRRYAKAFNAKTRRQRVESSQQGARWWKSAMRIFRRRGGKLDRDQVEDAELAQKEAREGMPGNVLDFKDHPYYALERHSKRHETIHPRREVGKVNAGTAAKPRMEPVFRRQDVQMCKSADKWYRLGREIVAGEQPLKHVASRNKRQTSSGDGDEEPSATTALYAPYQTQLYTPPPVQRGRIPKNVYGNLDIYVPSMVPPGGTHIKSALAQRAARLLKVDYAEAVTGFKFQGRHGTAIVEGAVVAEQYTDAVQAVIESIEHEMEEEASKARSLIALRMWKRFLTGLRVAERVSAYGDQSTAGHPPEDEEEFLPDPHGLLLGPEVDVPLVTAGRFTLADLTTASKPARHRKRKIESDTEDEMLEEYDGKHEADESGGFMPGDYEDNGGGFVLNEVAKADDGGFLPDAGPDHGGGFIPEEDDDGGDGGFIPDEIAEADHSGGYLPDAESDHGGGFIPDEEDINDDLFGEDPNLRSRDISAESEPQRQPDASYVASIDEDTQSLPARTKDLDYAPAKELGESGPEQAVKQTAAALPQNSQEHAEQDSLPSEDPEEDEDAEPDWLESD